MIGILEVIIALAWPDVTATAINALARRASPTKDKAEGKYCPYGVQRRDGDRNICDERFDGFIGFGRTAADLQMHLLAGHVIKDRWANALGSDAIYRPVSDLYFNSTQANEGVPLTKGETYHAIYGRSCGGICQFAGGAFVAD